VEIVAAETTRARRAVVSTGLHNFRHTAPSLDLPMPSLNLTALGADVPWLGWKLSGGLISGSLQSRLKRD
jgi:hypothetical protein